MRKLKALAVLVLAAVLMTSCSTEPTVKTEVYTDLFDTVTVISGYDKADDQFRSDCSELYALMRRFDELYDIYNSYDGVNNLKTVNDLAGGEKVSVAPEILDLLLFARDMDKRTGGLVNAAYGSVTRLWHDVRTAYERGEEAELPSEEDLELAAEHCSFESVLIDEGQGTVSFRDAGVSLDVGAVAKGYVCRYLCEYMNEKGMTGYLLSLGGNILTVGNKPGAEYWTVGVENPGIGTASYLMTLKLGADMSAVTSGSYQRYFEADGVRYHHIIDPVSHRPENRYLSVTVIGADSAVCDALSTALFNADEDEAMQLIEDFDGFEMMLVYEDGTLAFSSGFEQYIEERFI